jgi:hypothetical protein
MIYLILLTLVGILCGFLLALIAPEELKPGRKYFHVLKGGLFFSIVSIGTYALIPQYSLLVLIPVIFFVLFYFFKEYKLKNNWLDLAYYPIFIIPMFLTTNLTLQILIATAVFLYGFPLGTLLKHTEKSKGFLVN